MTLLEIIYQGDITHIMTLLEIIYQGDITHIMMILEIIYQCDITHIMTLLEIIYQRDITHIMTLPIKTITSVLKVLTHIITSITARPIRLVFILVIMSVSTFKTAMILFFT